MTSWGPDARIKDTKKHELVQQTPPTLNEVVHKLFGELTEVSEQASDWMGKQANCLASGLSTPRRKTWSLRWYLMELDVRTLAHLCPRDLELLRVLTDAASLMARPLVPWDISVKEVKVGNVRCLWNWPSSFESPELVPAKCLYVHGGAFCLGSPETHIQLTSQIATRGQIAVLSPDYRRCPEFPLSAAQEDCIEVYKWMVENCQSCGGDAAADGNTIASNKGVAGCPGATSNIVIGGESAGANIALSVALHIRDGRSPLPAPKGLALMSPWADLVDAMEQTSSSWTNNEVCFVLPDLAELFARWVLVAQKHGGVQWDAEGKEKFAELDKEALIALAKNADVSPALAKSFQGLPHTLVTIGDCETLRDSQLQLVERLREDGVTIEKEVYEDMPHAFALANFVAGGCCEQPSAVVDRFAAFVDARCGVPFPKQPATGGCKCCDIL